MSPERIACDAISIATRDDEQAVFKVMAGPVRLYVYETLALMMLEFVPVTEYVLLIVVSSIT
jgi:hypothetical protein